MSTGMLPISPTGVITCSTPTGHRKAGTSSSSKGKVLYSSKWWGPVVGWSTEPDYIDTTEKNKKKLDSDPDMVKCGSGSDPKVAVKSRFAPGTLTEEKARQLRMMTTETTAFHDAMYHSSIAAKLASDFSNKN